MTSPTSTDRKARARRARQGAVLVEAIITAAVLGMMFAILSFVHRAALANIDAQQEARAAAMAAAGTGCVGNQTGLQGLVSDLSRGDVPLPDGLTAGQSAEGSGSRKTDGLFGRAALNPRYVVRFPCNTRVSALGEDQTGSWLVDLF